MCYNMRIDCCAACGDGRHNAPTRSPTSQAHYIPSCLRTPAARCAAGAHGALCRTLQQTAQRHASRHGAADLAVLPVTERVCAFANFAKNSEIFRNCAEIRKEKEKKHNFGKFIFCGNLPAAPSLRWRSVLVAVAPTLDLRPSLRRPYRRKMSTYRYSFSSLCFLRRRFAGNARQCGCCR